MAESSELLHKLQDQLCQQIAEFSDASTSSTVAKALEPLLSQVTTFSHSHRRQLTQRVTPLMVACDKGNVLCLQYLLAQYSNSDNHRIIIGKVQAQSDCGRNTAVHHAAMSGCLPAVEILLQMMRTSVHTQSGDDGDDGDLERNTKTTGNDNSILKLCSLMNAHKDTPLQMAATAGHMEFFCEIWQRLSQTVARQERFSILLARNNSGDNCISLAACHGHERLLQFLLEKVQCHVEYTDFERCQKALERVQSARIRTTATAAAHKSHLDEATTLARHRQSIEGCLERLQHKLQEQSEAAAQQLLEQETPRSSNRMSSTSPVTTTTKQQPTGTRKKKKKKKPSGSSSVERSSTTTTRKGVDELSRPPFQLTQLPDGKVAVRVEGHQEGEFQPGSHNPWKSHTNAATTIGTHTQSPNDMFRDRFQTDIDETMHALCLDVSMLLYTPHGMALHLSASQLEAIQDILQQQLSAVQKARQIQERRANIDPNHVDQAAED